MPNFFDIGAILMQVTNIFTLNENHPQPALCVFREHKSNLQYNMHLKAPQSTHTIFNHSTATQIIKPFHIMIKHLLPHKQEFSKILTHANIVSTILKWMGIAKH